MVLNRGQSDEIRREACRVWENRSEIASRYGTTLTNVYRVLANKTHYDPNYDPKRLATQERPTPANSTPWEVVDSIRALRQREYLPTFQVAERFGVSEGTVISILKNTTRTDPNFDPDTIRTRDDWYFRQPRKQGFIYGLYCVCEKCNPDIEYVGQTVQDPEVRLSAHRNPSGADRYTLKAKWISAHGAENIRVRVLERDPEDGLDSAEVRWISKLGTLAPQGLNMTPGGYSGAGLPGERNNSSKLSEEQVKDIINLLDTPGVTSRSIASEYGVTKTLILKIDHGDLWPHLERPNGTHRLGRNRRAKLDPRKVKEIREKLAAGQTPKKLSEEYGVQPRDITNILRGVTWKDVA